MLSPLWPEKPTVPVCPLLAPFPAVASARPAGQLSNSGVLLLMHTTARLGDAEPGRSQPPSGALAPHSGVVAPVAITGHEGPSSAGWQSLDASELGTGGLNSPRAPQRLGVSEGGTAPPSPALGLTAPLNIVTEGGRAWDGSLESWRS